MEVVTELLDEHDRLYVNVPGEYDIRMSKLL